MMKEVKGLIQIKNIIVVLPQIRNRPHKMTQRSKR